MSGLQVTIDVQPIHGGFSNVAWGLRDMAATPSKTDELWLLYSLEARDVLADPVLYADGVTHELTVYSLDGSKIDFAKSLWDQKQLILQLPAQVSFQFVAAGDNDALMQVQGMMARMLRGFASLPTTKADWVAQFPDCVWVPGSPEVTAAEALHAAKIGHPTEG